MLDRTRPFSIVCGPAKHKYEQDGLVFDGQGFEIGAEPVIAAELPPAPVPGPPPQEPEPPKTRPQLMKALKKAGVKFSFKSTKEELAKMYERSK